MEVFQEHKRDIIAIVILVLLLSISIGYAVLSSNLTINGASQIKDAVWDIHWENVQITSGSVPAISTPTIDTNKTTVTYEVHFDTPGQFYEFTVDAKNAGTIDGMINTLNSTLNGNPISTLPNYFDYAVTYSDGSPISIHQELNSGDTETFLVRIEYKKDLQISDLPSTDQDLVLSFSASYVQKDSSAIQTHIPISFPTDSLETISRAVRARNTSVYHVGDTKEIDLGVFGIQTIRIANMSTPEECSQPGFSQTACGFVIDFPEIVFNSNVANPPTGDHTNHNYGGYPVSQIQFILNQVLYSNLPSDLKDIVLDTYTVSGHGIVESENFVTTEKVYLLTPTEILGEFIDTDDISSSWMENENMSGYTRQLDYYKNIGVSCTNTSGAIKMFNGTPTSYWMRSAPSNSYDYYLYVGAQGKINANDAAFSSGISPAFRIG